MSLRCLCDVIAAVFANKPNYQLNRTQLREMIVQCGLDVSASDTSCLPTLDGASRPTVAPPTTPAPLPSPPTVAPPTTPAPLPSSSTITMSPPTAPVTAPSTAPEVVNSPPPSPITLPSPHPPVLKSPPPPPAQNFEYPSPPPITRQSRSPPLPPDSSSTLLDSPPPPPEPITPPSSIIGAVLRNGQYCISPNLNYYVVFALLGILLY
ncbi:hypothetical protein KP509_05G033100 [Ceratopteris richardii]|uniref:Uncharacterized protein n=1 Tax=Ceratopteris richardii TaxID=49495 RepID=A0A8T2UQ68_CERRI|nr:hypothetical protein KP509_05G033100 [Ceratopteris richardii]